MSILSMRVSDANYMLRTGRASAADAREYAKVWNETKVSTQATVISYSLNGIKTPMIVVVDLP